MGASTHRSSTSTRTRLRVPGLHGQQHSRHHSDKTRCPLVGRQGYRLQSSPARVVAGPWRIIYRKGPLKPVASIEVAVSASRLPLISPGTFSVPSPDIEPHRTTETSAKYAGIPLSVGRLVGISPAAWSFRLLHQRPSYYQGTASSQPGTGKRSPHEMLGLLLCNSSTDGWHGQGEHRSLGVARRSPRSPRPSSA